MTLDELFAELEREAAHEFRVESITNHKPTNSDAWRCQPQMGMIWGKKCQYCRNAATHTENTCTDFNCCPAEYICGECCLNNWE